MNIEMNIEMKIAHQVEHCLALYCDNRTELLIKLEQLIMEWYIKGQSGFKICCPECKSAMTVHHLEWSALTCLNYRAEVKLEDCIG